MLEVMKIMKTSFKRSHAGTVALSAPNTARPLLIHTSTRDSSTLTGKSELVSSGVTVHFFCVLVHTGSFFWTSKNLFPQSCTSSGGSVVGLVATFSKRAYAIPRSAAPRGPAPVAGHC